MVPVFIPIQHLRCQIEDLRVRQVGGDEVRQPVNVPSDVLVQFTPALGAALLGRQRLRKLAAAASPAGIPA